MLAVLPRVRYPDDDLFNWQSEDPVNPVCLLAWQAQWNYKGQRCVRVFASCLQCRDISRWCDLSVIHQRAAGVCVGPCVPGCFTPRSLPCHMWEVLLDLYVVSSLMTLRMTACDTWRREYTIITSGTLEIKAPERMLMLSLNGVKCIQYYSVYSQRWEVTEYFYSLWDSAFLL